MTMMMMMMMFILLVTHASAELEGCQSNANCKTSTPYCIILNGYTGGTCSKNPNCDFHNRQDVSQPEITSGVATTCGDCKMCYETEKQPTDGEYPLSCKIMNNSTGVGLVPAGSSKNLPSVSASRLFYCLIHPNCIETHKFCIRPGESPVGFCGYFNDCKSYNRQEIEGEQAWGVLKCGECSPGYKTEKQPSGGYALSCKKLTGQNDDN